jgi:hypothetical protein
VAQAMGVDTRGMSDEAASMEAINAIRALSKRVVALMASMLAASSLMPRVSTPIACATRAKRATAFGPAADHRKL